MQQRYPGEESEATRDGEAAHFALSEQLNGRTVAHGQIAPNGVMLTEEMLEAADLAAEYIALLAAGATPGTIRIEERIPVIRRIHEQCFGTPDYSAWLRVDGRVTLFVADFKFGRRYVPAEGNEQLTAYATGLIDATKYSDQVVDVIFAIIQPRCYVGGGPVREWRGPATDLRGLVNRLHMAADEALGPDPKCRPNPGCGDCTARHACPALQKDTYRSAAYSEAAVPFDLPPAAAGLELTMLSDAITRLEARKTGLEAQVEAQVRSGMSGSGYRLESTPGREAWTAPLDEVLALGDMMGVTLSKPDVITPAQARKAGIDEAIVSGYAGRPAGAVKLVRDDAGRLARIFGGGVV